jgi:hypothetical protein
MDARHSKQATTQMSDIEKARELFEAVGLAFPTIPKELAARLKQRGEWCFPTRELKISPYELRDYVDETDCSSGEYVVLCHSGHGVNSYAIQYYVVYGPLRLFLHLGWGGAYMDAIETASDVRECFSLADEVVSAAMKMGKVRADERLTIVGSDFYGSYWFISGTSSERERDGSKSPSEVLTEVLQWLKTPPAN